MTYGLPAGTSIPYGGKGFPQWVYDLAAAFRLEPSTYPAHQESHRDEPGYAPNLQHLNRGIDWAGSVEDMHRFAQYLFTVRSELEQVIWQHPTTGQKIGVAGGKDVSAGSYYLDSYPGHRDHVHTRQSKPIPIPGNNKEKSSVWTGDPTWLADVLEIYEPHLKVRELPNWQQYGHGDFRDIRGIMVHHTGNARETAESIRKGRPDLPGPLSNLHIAPDGTVTVVAGGVCWHAGAGDYPWVPRDQGNWHLIGIECAWPSDTSLTPATQTRERWPDAQIIAMRDSCAAILKRLGYDSSRVIAHKEYAGKRQGKWDPGNLDMGWFRGEVAKSMRGEFKPVPVEDISAWSDRKLLEEIYRLVKR